MKQCNVCELTSIKKSRIRETPNLSTDARRSPDTEKNIQGFFFFFGGFGQADVSSCAFYSRVMVYIFCPLNYTALICYAVHLTEKF